MHLGTCTCACVRMCTHAHVYHDLSHLIQWLVIILPNWFVINLSNWSVLSNSRCYYPSIDGLVYLWNIFNALSGQHFQYFICATFSILYLGNIFSNIIWATELFEHLKSTINRLNPLVIIGVNRISDYHFIQIFDATLTKITWAS